MAMMKPPLNALLSIMILPCLLGQTNSMKEEARNQISFTDIYCDTNATFLYMHQQFDCIAEDGSQRCYNLGLLEIKQQKCLSCCSRARREPDRSRVIATEVAPAAPMVQIQEKCKETATLLAVIAVLTVVVGIMLCIIIIGILWCFAPSYFQVIMQCARFRKINRAGSHQNFEVEKMFTETNVPGLPKSTLGKRETTL